MFKEIITNEKLTYKAKGIFICGVGQSLTFDSLLKLSKGGRDSLRAGLKELIKYGYCKSKTYRGCNGQYTTTLYGFISK